MDVDCGGRGLEELTVMECRRQLSMAQDLTAGDVSHVSSSCQSTSGTLSTLDDLSVSL